MATPAYRMALDLVDVEALTLAAREIPFPAGILDRWLPPAQRLDHRYRFFKRDRSMRRAAPRRAWDTPATPVERGTVEEVTGRMLPSSTIVPLLEEEAQLLDAARAADNADEIEALFDNDVVAVTRPILQTVMLSQGEAISAGTVTVGTQVTPENQLQLGAVDFGLPSAHYFTAPTLWSDTANADVLGQIATDVQTYVTTTGQEVRPGVMIGSTAILNNMLANAALRAVFGSTLGTPATIGINQLNAILQERQLPRFIVDDTAVPDWRGVMTRQIPEDRVIFLPEEPALGGIAVGRTQWGTTEEAKKLVRAQAIDAANAPGLVVVPMESENPVQTATLGTGIYMPVVTEPDLIMSVKVR